MRKKRQWSEMSNHRIGRGSQVLQCLNYTKYYRVYSFIQTISVASLHVRVKRGVAALAPSTGELLRGHAGC